MKSLKEIALEILRESHTSKSNAYQVIKKDYFNKGASHGIDTHKKNKGQAGHAHVRHSDGYIAKVYRDPKLGSTRVASSLYRHIHNSTTRARNDAVTTDGKQFRKRYDEERQRRRFRLAKAIGRH